MLPKLIKFIYNINVKTPKALEIQSFLVDKIETSCNLFLKELNMQKNGIIILKISKNQDDFRKKEL